MSRYIDELEVQEPKAALRAAVKACSEAHELLEKYQTRYRTEPKEQVDQLKGCAANVAPSIAALAAARKQLGK